jgi:hypothetical protein
MKVSPLLVPMTLWILTRVSVPAVRPVTVLVVESTTIAPIVPL